LVSEVVTLLQLILVMPATNASSEGSFSAFRMVKNYLSSTMAQDRLNHTMLLHCHKELTDDLNLVTVANQFVDLSSHRLNIFGKFTNADIIPIGKCKIPLNCSSYQNSE